MAHSETELETETENESKIKSNQHENKHEYEHEHAAHEEGCGVRQPTTYEKNLDRLRMNALFQNKNATEVDLKNDYHERTLLSPSCKELCKQCIEIKVYFHLSGYPLVRGNESSGWVIPHPTDQFIILREELANATQTRESIPFVDPDRFSSIEHVYELIQDNMAVLNSRYADTPFVFQWVNSHEAEARVSVKRQNAFFFAGDLYTSNDYATATHIGDARTLNVNFVYRICGHPFIWLDRTCRTIGAAVNPSYQLDRTSDGVYLSYDTLTGGGFEGYDTGLSLVHEVGHWLGLFHVFESDLLLPANSKADPCNPINDLEGDMVDDTPFLPEPSVMMYECSISFYEGEEIPNSCPDLPGVDPVFNYMNYVGNEACIPEGVGSFTCGQIERMHKQWMLYRDHGEECAQNELKVVLAMELDAIGYKKFYMEIAPIDGQPVFRWNRDVHTGLLNRPGANFTRAFNFCAPSGEYTLAVIDPERNGFASGFIDLSVNDVLLKRIDGDFGSMECIRFGSNGKLADLATPGFDFGNRYQYQPPENSTKVTCGNAHDFLDEPIWIRESRYMRVNVSLEQQNEGVCINEVASLDIEIDGRVYSVFPGDLESDPDTLNFRSRVKSCGDSSCIVEFDLARLKEAYNPKNKDGIYDSSCKASLQIGFGAACDTFLAAREIECTVQGDEVWTNAAGRIQFSIPQSAANRQLASSISGLVVTAMLFSMQYVGVLPFY